ncbi:GTPase IMAP family member 5-like isoform X2 [Bos indicus]|uniref:GTPase IMAP family member 5-like isoform X2 n=1 Tax=Bos indicus TaxID=9915 RepID=A0A6P5B904_BOSIN
MGGGEALVVSEGKHPLGVRTLRTRRSPVSAAAVSPCPEGCPQLRGQEARALGQCRFPSSPAVVPCSLRPRAPADPPASSPQSRAWASFQPNCFSLCPDHGWQHEVNGSAAEEQIWTMAEGRIEHQGFEPSSSLRIILVGKTGSRESATRNSILSQPMFESKLGAQSVTRKCQRATGTWNGRSILVVDMPPIFESRAQDQEVYENIGACYLLSVPGPHVLLLVTKLGHFTKQDAVAVTRVKEVFGAGAERYMVILFTHKEDLAGGSLDEYMANTDNLRLRSLVQKCRRRYCAFNNWASGDEQRGQLAQLMAVIEGLEREHQGAFLTNELFFDAQMLQQMGGGAHGEGQRRYLDKVRLQVAKQKQDLKEAERNSAFKALLRLKAWIVSHAKIFVLVLCLLIFLAIVISLYSTHQH